MSAVRYPDFQRFVGYGNRFDDEITAGREAGEKLSEIAARIGVSAWFVGARARVLRLPCIKKRAMERRTDVDHSRPARPANTPSSITSLTITSRSDERASRIVRTLRQRPVVLDQDGLDPSHGVVCLHFAGLTLPEIEGLTGVPASGVVAALRQHCAPLGGSEARA